MSNSPHEQSEPLARDIERLKQEQERLFSEVNFLLGIAVPQLEHEYLYCISLLELEATRTQFEIAKIAERILWLKNAVEQNISVDEQKLSEALKELEIEWEPKINKHVHQGNADLLAATKFSYERDHLKFLLRETLDTMHALPRGSTAEAHTELLRRISAAYREGNLGELRALRMIIEGKERSAFTVQRKFSVKKFFRALRIRLAKFFSV